MDRTELTTLNRKFKEMESKNVLVCGWARTIRDSKNVAFLELNDGAFKSCQIVLEKEKVKNYDEIIKQISGTSFEVFGKVVLTPNSKQPYEINAETVVIAGPCQQDYPMQKKGHSLEFLRENCAFRPRTNTFNAVFKIRSVAAFAIHKFFNENNFVYIQTPIITASDCEGAGSMFQVTTLELEKLKGKEVDYSKDFFGKKAYLTVSGQIDEEPITHSFCKTYTFGPTFRAENSNTTRHAAEFWMMEPEMCFAELDDIIENEEKMVKYVISYILENCKDEVEFLNKFVDNNLLERLNNVVNAEFVRLNYTDAIKILEKNIQQSMLVILKVLNQTLLLHLNSYMKTE